MIPFANTVGEILRKTREERGLTLEQASGVTRVKLQYLQALENDDPHLLPSVVQARGFLRLYADYLNLPVQPLLDAWPDRSPVFLSAEEQSVEPIPEPPEVAQKKQRGRPTTEKPTPPAEPLEMQDAAPEPVFVEELEVEAAADKHLSGSQAIFTQMGAELRQRRETISLSIEDVEKFTHLRSQYIIALEEGRLDRLPSLVQGRGMLANYAEFLDLDVDAILTRFADALQTRRLEIVAANEPEKDDEKKAAAQKAHYPGWRRFLTPDLMIGGTLFVLFFILVIWGAARVNEMSADTLEPTPPSISEVLLNTSVFEEAPTPAGTLEPTASEQAAAVEPVQPSSTLEAVSSETSTPPVSSAPLQISIVSSQRTWMQVAVDNSVVFKGRTIPGNAYQYTGYDSIELIAGNASALTVVFNGQNLGTLGQFGEVIRQIFSAEGILTPTAQFTATATITLIPTDTLRPTPIPATPTVTPLIP